MISAVALPARQFALKNKPTVPRRGEVAVENVRGHWPSMSVAETVTVTGVSSKVESLAAEAVGGSLTQVIKIVTVAALGGRTYVVVRYEG